MCIYMPDLDHWLLTCVQFKARDSAGKICSGKPYILCMSAVHCTVEHYKASCQRWKCVTKRANGKYILL